MLLIYLMIYFVITLSPLVLTWKFDKKFRKFSSITLKCNLSGHEVVERMLADNGIRDIQITRTSKYLRNHYDSFTKTIALSNGVYDGCNVAAVAVAAHECGHTVQHARGYVGVNLRSMLVPAISSSNRITPFLVLGSLLIASIFPVPFALMFLIWLVVTLFSFIALPVEFNASRRGLAWIQAQGQIISSKEHEITSNALWWAAMAYMVGALASFFKLGQPLFILYNLYKWLRWGSEG